MLNRSGIRSKTGAAPVQILANIELQASVGCIVDDAIVTSADSNGNKIAKAGTPIKIDLGNPQTPAVAATKNPADDNGSTNLTDMNAVLLHDVDVTNGDANGTALIFGFVNINRVDSTTAAKLKAGTFAGITFLKR